MTKTKAKDLLPKIEPPHLPGTVHAQYVRCGRAGCKCANGASHGPYYYRFYRQGGRLHKQYVRRADAASVEARCKARQEQSAHARRIVRASRQEWRRLVAMIRRLKERNGR